MGGLARSLCCAFSKSRAGRFNRIVMFVDYTVAVTANTEPTIRTFIRIVGSVNSTAVIDSGFVIELWLLLNRLRGR